MQSHQALRCGMHHNYSDHDCVIRPSGIIRFMKTLRLAM